MTEEIPDAAQKSSDNPESLERRKFLFGAARAGVRMVSFTSVASVLSLPPEDADAKTLENDNHIARGYINTFRVPSLFSDGGAKAIGNLSVAGQRDITFDTLKTLLQKSSEQKEDKKAALQLIELFQDPNPFQMWFIKIFHSVPYEFQGEDIPDIRHWGNISKGNKAPKQVIHKWNAVAAEYKKKRGKKLTVESAYRSPAYQLYTFAHFFQQKGNFKNTLSSVSLPYFSEHGTRNPALDIEQFEGSNTIIENLVNRDWKLFRNIAEKHGFVVSYPFGTEKVAKGFGEPWHIRYLPDKVKGAQEKRENEGEFGIYTLKKLKGNKAFSNDVKEMKVSEKTLTNAILFARLLKSHTGFFADDILGVASMNAKDTKNLSRTEKDMIRKFTKLIQGQLGIQMDGEYGSGTHKKIKNYFTDISIKPNGSQ